MTSTGLLEQLQARIDSVERRIGLNAYEQSVLQRLDAIEELLSDLTTQGASIMSEISDLVAQVAETRGVEEAAVAAFQALRAQINTLAANATELETLKAQLLSLTSELDTSEQALATAIATPPPEPPPAA